MVKKVVLITGAARRIGAATARHLHANDFNIVIHYHNSGDEAGKLCEELNRLRDNSCAMVTGDLLDIAVIEDIVQQSVQFWDRLDVLINNASTFFPTEVGDITDADWLDLLGTNVKAPLFMAQAAYSTLAKHAGCIVNIADIHGIHPLKGYTVYSVAKAGLVMLTKSLAKELAPGVRVNAIAPGGIIWPEGENELTIGQQQAIIEKTALKTHGKAEHIAKAVAFLIESEFVTGQVIAVDGGRYI